MFASKQLYLSSGEVDPLTREPFIIQVTISDFPPAPDIPPPDQYWVRVLGGLTSGQPFYVDFGDGTGIEPVVANTAWIRYYYQGGTYIIKIYANTLYTRSTWLTQSNVAQARYPTTSWKIISFGNAAFFQSPAAAINAGDETQPMTYDPPLLNTFPNTTLCTSFNNVFNGMNNPSVPGSEYLFPYPQISNWNTQNVVEMFNTFVGTNFQENINTWNVGNVISFRQTFLRSTFNQPLDNWNVSSAKDMRNMFAQSSFNQNVGMWQLNKANSINSVNLNSIFFLSSMSAENYSKTLIGWANYVYANGGSPNGVDMRGQNGMSYNNTNYGGTPFSDSYAARAFLTTSTGGAWLITGDTAV